MASSSSVVFDDLRVVQITDTHLFKDPSDVSRHGIRAFVSCSEVLSLSRGHSLGGDSHLDGDSSSPFDFLIHTGDVSGDDSSRSYELLASLIKVKASQLESFSTQQEQPALVENPHRPVVVITPGNHDVVSYESLQEVAHTHKWTIPPKASFRLLNPHKNKNTRDGDDDGDGPWRILIIDTAKHDANGDAVHGAVSHEAIEAMRSVLSEDTHARNPSRRFLVVMHHPPIPPGNERSVWNKQCLANADEFLNSLPPPPENATHSVRYILLHGHTHSLYTRVGTDDGLPAWCAQRSCPSTCHQYLEDAETFTCDRGALPAYQQITLHADGMCTMRVRRLDELSERAQTGAYVTAEEDSLDANSLMAAFAKASEVQQSGSPVTHFRV